VVVVLCATEARVLAVGYLLAGFLCLWCHIVVEAAGRFHGLVVGAVGGGWIAYMLDRTEVLTSVPVTEGYRLLAGAMLVLLFPCQCIAFFLQPVDLFLYSDEFLFFGGFIL
jgi:hypothetical protein